MKVNELRVGNIVKLQDHFVGGNAMVTGIMRDRITAINSVGTNIDTANIMYVEPISITDELLLKNGFEQCDYLFKTLFIEMYEVASGWHLHIDNERFETALSITIKYVHELQNAYYVSTGEEMEIKL